MMVLRALTKRRAVGFLLVAVLLTLFLLFNRIPKLDTVRGDLAAVTAPQVECFQGFCIEKDPQSTLLSRWWNFSLTYLKLVTRGMVFAFLIAGATEVFLFPRSGGRMFAGGGIWGAGKGLLLGLPWNLCSGCIVPVANSFRRTGSSVEATVGTVMGSTTLNPLAILMVLLVFSPTLAGSRIALGVVGALLIGPVVAMVARERKGRAGGLPGQIGLLPPQPDTWKETLTKGLWDWLRSSFGYFLRLGPVMVVGAFASGLVVQWISPHIVASFLGNNMLGVLLAATLGLLINVPLLFEIPLVVLLLLLGMGAAPAATLLFTAAAAGPITFLGLRAVMPSRAIATFAGAIWVLGIVGGLGILVFESAPSGYQASVQVRTASAFQDESSLPLRTGVALRRPDPVNVLETAGGGPTRVLGETLFTEVGARAGVDFRRNRGPDMMPIGGGAVVLDYNNDGLYDIYVVNTHALTEPWELYFQRLPVGNALYRNNGDGTFTDIAVEAGVAHPFSRSNGGCAADFENDGNVDLFVTAWGSSRLFRNSGDGTFADVTATAGVADPDFFHRTTGCAWGDYDKDGFLDLLVVRHMDESRSSWFRERQYARAVRPLSLFHNNGDGTFTNATHILGNAQRYPSNIQGAGFQPGFVDYDNDGDQDIYVVNDFGRQNYPNVLWRNDGPDPRTGWRFTDVSNPSGAAVAVWGMALAVGDYDNDGYMDFYMTNIGDSVLLRNRGDGTFQDTASYAGVGLGQFEGGGFKDSYVGWGAAFFDYDNDGFLDLYVSRGYLDSDSAINPVEQPNVLLRNNGDGTFADISLLSGADDAGISRGVVYADFNNDGRLDLFVVNTGKRDGSSGTARLFLNTVRNANNWLIVKPVGAVSNRDGIGARVKVVTPAETQVREVRAGDSQMSQSMVPVHFGLGPAEKADLVQIQWPSGIVQTLRDVPANQVLQVVEGSSAD